MDSIIIVYLSIVLASGVLFVNAYNSLIDAVSWGANIPHSIQTARSYFAVRNAGYFFRVVSPLNQIIAFIALILYWKSILIIRLFLLSAFLLYVASDVLTFAYFYPRNEILFIKELPKHVDILKKTWQEWAFMNWVRSFIAFTGLIFSLLSLHKIYMMP